MPLLFSKTKGMPLSDENDSNSLRSNCSPVSFTGPVYYTPEDIIRCAADYCKRVRDVDACISEAKEKRKSEGDTNPQVNNYQLETEALVLNFDKDMLLSLLGANDCQGVYAILCIDKDQGDNQSVILVPYDSSCDAITPPGNEYIALQQWPPESEGRPNGRGTLGHILNPPTNPEIDQKVREYMRRLGIE